MNHDEVNGDNYKDKKDHLLDYVNSDAFCTFFSYARYCRVMDEITGFSKEDSLSAPGLGWKFFNSLRTEEDEHKYTYNDKSVRHFVRQSIKSGRVCSFNEYYQLKTSDDVIKLLSRERKIEGNVYDNIEAYMKKRMIV